MFKKQLKIFIIFSAISGVFLAFSYFLNIPSVEAITVSNDPDSTLIKELLFTVEDSQGDAIGVKIMGNPQRLPPLLWYNQNVSNPASPGYSIIDNYYALRDGRTAYVGAPNVNILDNTISSYIYIFSYNEGASSETINIFNQLLENLRFNNNLNNPTEKGEIQRDLLRIYDISEAENSLNDYYNLNNHYPLLSSGTYIPKETYTTWPSWQYTLSSELGQSLPVDPLNRFNGSCSACPDDPTQPDYQCNGTCYNPASQTFSHPYGSHVYRYLTSDDDLCAEQGYSLFANLEYKPDADNVTWLGTENIIINLDDDVYTHNYVVSKGMGTCDNGTLESCEECEIIDASIVPADATCTSLGLGSGTLNCVDCRWAGCDKLDDGENCSVNTECSSGYCSDGVCCDNACEGLCQNCAGGTCDLVAYGGDPRNVCAIDDCSTGYCDGFGACEIEVSGVSCGICKYCSVNGQCINTYSGEDYNNQCTDDPANCEAGYCDGYGSCSYYPEGFICNDCKKCNIQVPSICTLVPANTQWGTNFFCNAGGNFVCYNNWGNCDSDWANGCETSLLSNDTHCGVCGNVCDLNTECDSSGNCVCQYGYGDCNGVTLDGCETNFSIDDDHCGVCGNACEDNYLCCNYGCVESQFADDFPTENSEWTFADDMSHVDITLANNGVFYTGEPDDSIRFQQDANEPYYGTCSQAVCEGATDPSSSWPNSFPYKDDCVWETGSPNVCNFTDHGSCGDCDVDEGDYLIWPWTNRVMWGKTVYNISDFALQADKEYVFSFYYKGYTTSDVSIRLCYSLGHCSQSYPCNVCYADGDCNAACDIDFNDPTDACGKCRFRQYPFQTAPYPQISLGSLPKGDYPSWQKYIYSFVYTSEMANTLNADGDLRNEVGLSIGYNDTEASGTDFYVDDIRFKGCPLAIPPGEDCVGQSVGVSCGYKMICDDSENCVCEENWGDCDGNTSNGCETDLLESWFYCGSCAIQCYDDEDCIDGECEGEGGGGGGVSP